MKVSSLKLEGKISTLRDRQPSLLDSSSKIDSLTKIFEQAVFAIVQLTSEERIVRKMGEQIRKTQKRVNALDNILIKEIKDDIYTINEALEDQDREEIAKIQSFMKKRKN